MNARLLISLALSSFILTVTAHPTTIVAIRTSTGITIAADSKATFRGRDHHTGVVCKIMSANGVYFAVAGLARDTERGYNAERILSESFSGSGPFSEKWQKAKEALDQALTHELLALREHQPPEYEAALRAQSSPLTIVVATVEESIPRLELLSFVWDRSTLTSSRKEASCPGTCENGTARAWVGETVSIQKDLKSRYRSRAENARKWVQLEIQDAPERVGPPIVSIELSSSGVHWDDAEGVCSRQ